MGNAKLGRATETRCLQWLSDHGWWCHRMEASASGQPCDIVALCGNDCMLIDAKHCDEPYLRTSRIEPNQRTCFKYASERFGIKCGFMCEYESRFYWISWEQVDLSKSRQEFSWGLE